MARQQVLDHIYIKFGVKFAVLNLSMKEYDFEGDQDIKDVEKFNLATRE